MYSLRIAPNGQPSITADDVSLYGLATSHATLLTSTVAGRECVTGKPHVSYGNDGERRVTGITDVANFRTKVKKAGARTRKTTRCIKVLPPAAMLAARDEVESAWQQWVADGLPHSEMRRRAINHPAFRAVVDA